jgi:hypothetical protein
MVSRYQLLRSAIRRSHPVVGYSSQITVNSEKSYDVLFETQNRNPIGAGFRQTSTRSGNVRWSLVVTGRAKLGVREWAANPRKMDPIARRGPDEAAQIGR